MEERLSKHRRFQHLSYGGQDVPKLRLSYQAIKLSSSYANFHPHVHRFFGCCIYRCTPILPDNNMLHSPLGFPIRISCGMIGLLLSPSFLDIFTYRLLKADFEYTPLRAHHFLLDARVASTQRLDFRVGQRRFIHIVAGADGTFAGHNLADELLLVFHRLPQISIKRRLCDIAVDVHVLVPVALTNDSPRALLQIPRPPRAVKVVRRGETIL